jgi:hypothetical protein
MPIEANSVARYEGESSPLVPIHEAMNSSIPPSHELEGVSPYSPILRKPLPTSLLDSSPSTNPLIVGQECSSEHIPSSIQLSPLPPATENEEEGEDVQLRQELERAKAKKLRLQRL